MKTKKWNFLSLFKRRRPINDILNKKNEKDVSIKLGYRVTLQKVK